MDSLSKSQRQVLVLSYFEHMTQPEIADRLGIPLTMVQVSAASALRRLAVALTARGQNGRSRDLSRG
ncbi:MAG: hypothetical protein PVSMB1_18600 [Gemmatimonadaceae bacterium]